MDAGHKHVENVDSAPPAAAPADPSRGIAALLELVPGRLAALADVTAAGHVASDLDTVHRALRRIRDEQLARGPVFCEWGSGLGAAASMAALLGFDAHGIEIDDELVGAARQLAHDCDARASFAVGTFLRTEDQALMADSAYDHPAPDTDAWGDLGLAPDGCDIVFTYPWPGEERLLDRLFVAQTTPGALLLTFHGDSLLLVQRHVAGSDVLEPLGWM